MSCMPSFNNDSLQAVSIPRSTLERLEEGRCAGEEINGTRGVLNAFPPLRHEGTWGGRASTRELSSRWSQPPGMAQPFRRKKSMRAPDPEQRLMITQNKTNNHVWSRKRVNHKQKSTRIHVPRYNAKGGRRKRRSGWTTLADTGAWKQPKCTGRLTLSSGTTVTIQPKSRGGDGQMIDRLSVIGTQHH